MQPPHRRHPRGLQPGAAAASPTTSSTLDLALREALEREGGGWAHDRLARPRRAGRRPPRRASTAGARAQRAAAEDPRPLRPPVDEVELDPSWHWLLAARWSTSSTRCRGAMPGPGAHVVRAALMLLWRSVNVGVMCPISMTYAAVPALREDARDRRRVGAAAHAARLRARRARRAWR